MRYLKACGLERIGLKDRRRFVRTRAKGYEPSSNRSLG